MSSRTENHWSDSVFFWVSVAGLVTLEVLIFARQDPPWMAAGVVLLGSSLGFLGSTFVEWMRFYVYWHPRPGLRRGEDEALQRIDHVIGIAVGMTSASFLIASYLDWVSDLVARLLLGLMLGFFLYQLWPHEATKERWFLWVGRGFLKVFPWLSKRRRDRVPDSHRT